MPPFGGETQQEHGERHLDVGGDPLADHCRQAEGRHVGLRDELAERRPREDDREERAPPPGSRSPRRRSRRLGRLGLAVGQRRRWLTPRAATPPRPATRPRAAAGPVRRAHTRGVVVLDLDAVRRDLHAHGVALDRRPRRSRALDGQRSASGRARRACPSRARARRRAAAASTGSASACTVCAGRPFFMTIGVTHASCAPASSSAAIVWASVSPVASSTFASSSTTGWPCAARRVERRADDDLRDVRQVARGRGVPAPKPVASIVIAGIGPKPDASAARIAGARRRGELDAEVDAAGRRVHRGEQLDDRRRRVRQQPVGGADHPRAGRDRAGARPSSTSSTSSAAHDADDVDDGVERADLVEVHLLGRAAVERGPRPRRARRTRRAPGRAPARAGAPPRSAPTMWAYGAHDRGLLGVDVSLRARRCRRAAPSRPRASSPRTGRRSQQRAHLVEVGAGVDERRRAPCRRRSRRSSGTRRRVVSHAHRWHAPRRRRRRSRCRCRRR